ncbi:MAG TPA: 1-deoxy-D-xylulose-5-phosphate reductoisomerase [Burkholderiales bacterium]|nr:1-deoxy-D-xylulose-5-phosphate reductoisomerase [Burkholderiales bacterium]
MTSRTLTILGATGSIGASTLDVVNRHPERFRVVALAAHSRVDAMLNACTRVRPRFAAMVDVEAADRLRSLLRGAGVATEVLAGNDALLHLAGLPEVDTVVAAIVGAAGLRSTLAAAQAGKRILLANKESLVMAGALLMRTVQQSGAQLLPIDSEHNAILQSLPARFGGNLAGCGVRRILLTASGGPFRRIALERLRTVTPDQACAHPNWTMGRKISVDSATMMNKGLEVIEAHWLFAAAPEQIEVVIHPQSVVHSMVEYIDGSVIAQLGNPDMRTPIAHALAFPERIDAGVSSLNFFDLATLHFERPDLTRFPCLRLAYEALRAGGTAPAILNAANEVAVDQFLKEELAFDRIAAVIEEVLGRVPGQAGGTLEAVLEADRRARDAARACLAIA